jgi:hypothetical protein
MLQKREVPLWRAPIRRLLVLAAVAAIGCGPLGTATLAAVPTSKSAVTTPKKASRYAAGGMPAGARQYYAVTWGVDQLSVKLAESGALVRFSYRVIDAAKAQVLQDKAANPNLIDEAAHVSLVVPSMDKVGPLRQSMPAEIGKSYWMAFSNKGNMVKSGHRVSVVIGAFRADGLIIQ